jgi:hypothetical protein
MAVFHAITSMKTVKMPYRSSRREGMKIAQGETLGKRSFQRYRPGGAE